MTPDSAPILDASMASMTLDYWHFCLVFPLISFLFLALALCLRMARVFRGPLVTKRLSDPPTSYDEPEAIPDAPPKKKRDF